MGTLLSLVQTLLFVWTWRRLEGLSEQALQQAVNEAWEKHMIGKDAPIRDHTDLIRQSVQVAEESILKMSEHSDCTDAARQLLTVFEIFTSAQLSILEGIEKALDQTDMARGSARALFDGLEHATLLIYAARIAPKDRALRYAAVADQLLAASLVELEGGQKKRQEIGPAPGKPRSKRGSAGAG